MATELRTSALALSVGLVLAGWPSAASAWCQMTTSRLTPTSDEPCILVSNHPGEYPLAWRRRCTSISLSTVDASQDLSEASVREVLGRSIATWEQVDCGGASPGLDIEILEETNVVSHARHFANGRNVNALIFVHSGWVEERMHEPRALAVTYVWHDPSTGEIFDADLELNEERNTFVICPSGGCTATPSDTADLENTLTHELGHYFGVAHTPDDPLATMWSYAESGEVLKRDLSADDEAAICTIYPPGTLPAACDYTPRGGLGLDGLPPPGCAVGQPGMGHAGHLPWLMAFGVGVVVVLRRKRAL